jgi:mRNA interferase RelE/StbE
MKYKVYFKAKAIKDLSKISKNDAKKIIAKIEEMENDLQGDVKKLTNHTPEYRLRVGDWRILFETKIDKIIIYKIKHRKDAYR